MTHFLCLILVAIYSQFGFGKALVWEGCRGLGEVADFHGRLLLMCDIVLVLSRSFGGTVYGKIECQ